MPKIKKKKSANPNSFIIKSVLTGSAVGISVFFALTTLLVLLAYTQDLEESFYPYLIMFASGMSAFIGGFTAVVPIKRNGLFMGTICTLPAFFFVIATASIVSRAGVGLWGWICLGIMLIMGGIGGILAANKQKRVKIK